ncbi:MAG: hypothetical protein JOY85_09145 [Acidobacteriaceae bacterium]|nr:hypothetical protein [Acidobacteriaceae bacterium]
MRRFVVLLKHGVLEAVECQSSEVFLLARVRGAGICGVFDDRETAENYINKHRLPPGNNRSISANPSR